SDAAANDVFGSSVSISGDTVVVGAPWAHTAAGAYAGAAYVFLRSGITWTEQQKLTPSDAAAGDFFGSALSVSGDTALVGAYRSGLVTDVGSAYVFARSGTSWTEQQKLRTWQGTR